MSSAPPPPSPRSERRRSLGRRDAVAAGAEAVGGDHTPGEAGGLGYLQGAQHLGPLQHPAHGQGAGHQGGRVCARLLLALVIRPLMTVGDETKGDVELWTLRSVRPYVRVVAPFAAEAKAFT